MQVAGEMSELSVDRLSAVSSNQPHASQCNADRKVRLDGDGKVWGRKSIQAEAPVIKSKASLDYLSR